MNSLYSQGVRQTTSIQTDLERIRDGDSSTALQGHVAASLASLNRTVDDYESMAKRELIKAKQEKAQMRVQKFRSDYNELRNQFERLKTQAAHARETAERSELLSINGAPPTTARQRFNPTSPKDETPSESPFRTPSSSSYGPSGDLRQSHALREHSFARNADSQLDVFLAQGREVYESLVEQKMTLKGTQKRLLDAANTLGLSRDVIGWIEKRSKQDTIIFFVGAVFTFVCFYFIWRWFG